MKKPRLAAYFIGSTLAVAQPSAAQAQLAEQPAEQNATAKTATRDLETINEQFDELTEDLAQQTAESENLQSKIEQYKKSIDKREAEKEESEFAHYREMSQLMTELKNASMRRINIYGFFDVSFYKNFIEKFSGFHILVPKESTFAITNLNLYFQSELVEDVTFLSEIKFSYQPDGHEEAFEIENIPNSKYVQIDTKVQDPYTIEQFDQGGISIVRANLTYQPLDYFYIKAGRFISPYGIWNVDHGSPVVLPTRVPYMQLRLAVPSAQTGLMVGGRVFPTDSMILNYALTLSNGRDSASYSPASDALFDTDEHKALGLRLKGTWQHRDIQISLGSYVYIGSERAIRKVLTIGGPMTDPEGKVPEDRPGIAEVKDAYNGHEYEITADFKLDWQGLRLQAEYVWRYWHFSVPKLLTQEVIISKGGTPYVDQWYDPNYTGYDIYCLIAYALPLQRLIGDFRITPYYLFERSVLVDVQRYEYLYIHIGGLNIAPWPAVVLKLEVACIVPQEKKLFGSRVFGLATQMAVSF